jgi:NAD(P)-dependent dehydrogenase (short-subunit alcohol dehydrogenase family)
MTFRGNVALVTGAASGMGQLSAWRLAADGVRVAALDVNEGGLSATA